MSSLLPEGVTPTAFLLKDLAGGDGEVVAHASGGITDDRYDYGWGPERVLYAAIRHPRGYVFGAVVRYRVKWRHETIDYIPNREIWWKVEDESCGPTFHDMPARVFNQLSPLADLGESPDGAAGQWRAATAARIVETGARPKVRSGDTIRFDEEISFADDMSFRELVFEGRDIFKAGWYHYRVPGWRRLGFEVVAGVAGVVGNG